MSLTPPAQDPPVERRNGEVSERRESVLGYQELFESNPQPMCIYDLETLKFLAVNEAFVASYGYSRSEFAAMRILDIRPPEDVPRLAQRIAEARKDGKRQTGIWRHRGKDGRLFDVEITSGVFDFGGRRAQLVLANDVTERLRAERKLRESEARFRSLTEMSSDFYWESDAEHRLRARDSANQKSSTVSVFQRGAQMGERRWEIPYIKPGAAGWQAHRAVLDAHLPFRIFELSRLGTDGTERHISISGDPVFEVSGAFAGYRGVGTDITERKRAEAKIQRLTQLYAALSRCNEAIVRAGSEEELFPQVCRAAVESGGMKLARVSLVDPATRMIRVAASAGESSEDRLDLVVSLDADSPYGGGLTSTAIRENRPLWCQDFMNDPSTAPWHERGARMGWQSEGVLPLHRNGAVIGAFVVFDGVINAFDEPRRQLFLEMAKNISFALDNFDRESRRRQAEQALRESEARFRSLTEMSSDFYWESDAEHRLTQRSSGSRRNALLALTHDDWLGRRRWEIPCVAPDESGWQAHRAVLDAHRLFRDFEFSRLGVDGRERHISINGDPVFDESGAFQGYRGVGADITERKRAERALLEGEQRLRLALNSARMAAWEWEVTPDVLSWTEHPGWLVGPEPAGGYADFREFVHPQDRDAFIQVGQRTLTAGAPYHAVFRIRRTDGVERWIEAQGEFLHSEKSERIIGVSQDVTERKQHEYELQRLNEELEQRVAERTRALEAANKELEAFSYSVSHDLRAPLRAVNGFSSLLEKDYAELLDEQGKDMLRRVGAGAETMGHLIDDLLKLSRISQQAIQIAPLDLSVLAREAAAELSAEEPGRAVEWLLASQVAARGDPGLLGVVLRNLIGNAWKYSSKRDAARIEFGVTEKAGRPVYFVRDNGVGFNIIYANKLFGAFQRLHSAAEFPGSGIGLATVARVVHRHGGEVWAEGRVGEGATFYFSLG